jgi:aminoglycoside phosphotransferase (APT) family kinase protein
MRENWSRAQPVLILDPDAVAALVSAAIPGASVESAKPAGGLANTSLDVRLNRHPWRVLLRLYQRAPAEAWKETVIAELVADHDVPVAQFLHFAETNDITGHPYAVLEWIDGQPLESLASTIDDQALVPVAQRVGQVLARIHAISFERAGFFDRHLDVPTAIDLGRDGLLAYLQHCLVDGIGGERLGAPLTGRVIRFVEREGHALDAWAGRPCLVHADFNGSNILVCQTEMARWEVGAILDWEYAFSGSPSFDLGHVLRPPLGERAGFAAAMADGYRESGGSLPDDWRRIAQIADLHAWADLLNRREIGDAVIADARRLIARTVDGQRPNGA